MHYNAYSFFRFAKRAFFLLAIKFSLPCFWLAHIYINYHSRLFSWVGMRKLKGFDQRETDIWCHCSMYNYFRWLVTLSDIGFERKFLVHVLWASFDCTCKILASFFHRFLRIWNRNHCKAIIVEVLGKFWVPSASQIL